MFKKNMKRLLLVHASWSSKVYTGIIRPFVSSKVFEKVVYCERLTDLYLHIDRNALHIWDYVQCVDNKM